MMKPDDIPQDVWKAALAAQDRAIERCETGRLAYRFPTYNGKAVLDEEIARAILAERERCVLIARSHVFCDWSKPHGEVVDGSYGEAIAAAIRKGGE